MRLLFMDKTGIKLVVAKRCYSKKFNHSYYSVTHGEMGEGCWQLRFPIPAQTFPADLEEFNTEGVEFRLVDLVKDDSRGNRRFLLDRGKPDGKFLLFVKAEGGASLPFVYSEGEGEKLGCSGHSPGNSYEVFLISGDAKIGVERFGVPNSEPVYYGVDFSSGVYSYMRRFCYGEA